MKKADPKNKVESAAEPSCRVHEIEVADLQDYHKPREVFAAVADLFSKSFSNKDFSPIAKVFPIVGRLYEGRFPGYRACNTEYHDYCHVLEVFSACARLLDGAALSKAPFSATDAADVLVAALLHDAGYIQESADREGTGAKHTRAHVARSADFVRVHDAELGLDAGRAARIGRLILGTELGSRWEEIEFEDEDERLAAAILAAADLLGQMADRAYLEKLLFLYYEFREAGIEGYATAFDILKKTAGFYGLVKARLDGPLGAASAFARPHFAARLGVDRDLYREAIARQMAYLDSILADDKANFRSKLKRLDIEEIERRHAS